jgi:hypothetical protein
MPCDLCRMRPSGRLPFLVCLALRFREPHLCGVHRRRLEALAVTVRLTGLSAGEMAGCVTSLARAMAS